MARVDYFDAIRFGVNEETLPACHFALTGMARLLERQTGAVVYCAAVWVDEQDATHYYECTNDSLSDILVRDDTMIVRGRLVELIRHQLGACTYTRRCASVDIVIQGRRYDLAFEMPGLARTVPHGMTIDQGCHHNSRKSNRSDSWCLNIATSLPGLIWLIDWEAIGSDFDSKTHALVSRRRLPNGIRRLDHPEKWDREDIERMAHWIRLGQQQLDKHNTSYYENVFQWREPGAPDVLRLVAHPDATLQYPDEAGKYLVATVDYGFTEYTYTDLPSRPRLLSKDVFTTLLSLLGRWPAYKRLIELAEQYERFSPPQRRAETSDPVIISRINLNTLTTASAATTLELPDAFLDYSHSQHSQWSVATYVCWIVYHSGISDDVSGLLCGGFTGAMRVIVATAAMRHTLYHWQRRGLRRTVKPSADLEDQMSTLEDYLTFQLERGISSRRPVLRSGYRNTPWPDDPFRYYNHLGMESEDRFSSSSPPST
ncbi:hypothetical protein FRC12_013728 [Ceratobasidium sp. 428]|nr:hypothetical protein FRC12_013728 [Ceratobasidium sp. 428]